MKFQELYSRTMSEDDTFLVAIQLNIINYETKICSCNSEMRIEINSNSICYRKRWRCRRASCRKSYSILHGTIFYELNVPISTVLRIFYMHCLEVKVIDLANEFNLNQKTVYLIITKFKSICLNQPTTYLRFGGYK